VTAPDPESLYLQLGALVAEMPALAGPGPVTAEMNRWLGRAAVLVEQAGDMSDGIALTTAANFLNTVNRQMNAGQIEAVVYRALARAEERAPSAARGAFIGKGAALDALQAVGRALGEARRELLIVDPYVDSTVLTDFAPTATEGVSIKILSDSHTTKAAAIEPAARRWVQQFGTTRPLEVRLSPPRALHDRLIFADGATAVWTLTQSLKDIAGRSPASLIRESADLAQMKLDHYLQVWASATPV
jgi:PLD-like domain